MDICEVNEKPPQPVYLRDINDAPGPYCMSFGFQIEALTRSIERVGLINSPVLVTTETNSLDVVMGYRRVLASKALGWDKLPCRVLSESEASPFECFLLNLYDNLSIRVLNDVEKGMILSRLSQWLERDEVQRHYMPILNLPSNETTLDLYVALDRELDREIKDALITGRLSMHSAARLLQLDHDTRSSVFRMISILVMNINQQRQFIDYISDISHTHKLNIGEVLKETDLVRICDNPRLNTPQKASTVLKLLRSRLFPRLTRAEASFKKTISALDLPHGVRINAPPFFEAADYRMEVLFKSGKELIPKIAQLSRMEDLEKIKDPWEEDQ